MADGKSSGRSDAFFIFFFLKQILICFLVFRAPPEIPGFGPELAEPTEKKRKGVLRIFIEGNMRFESVKE